MKFKKGLLVICIIICLFAISSISATEDLGDSIASTDLDDSLEISEDNQIIEQDNNEEIISEVDDGTFTALKNKINKAASGSTITLENDYKYDDACDPRYGIIIKNKQLTINGNGHKIDGLSKSRLFYISGSDHDSIFMVTLTNIVFCNGYSDDDNGGGAIYASESTLNSNVLIIRNCNFTGNKAKDGGAITMFQGRCLDISGCVFNSNTASDYGGAIAASLDPHKLNDCTFIKNSAKTGGAINFGMTYSGCQNQVNNCVFTSNYATVNGGAISSVSELKIDSSTFNSNTCKNNGGAIYEDVDKLTVKNSKFTSNHALNGGAVYFYGGSNNPYTCLIESSSFTKNIADKSSGAIYDGSKTVTTKSCTFSNNQDPSTNKITLKLKAVKVKKSAKKLVLTATLKKGSSPMKYTKVTFKFNGKKHSAKTNENGVAKYTIKKKVLKKLKVGKKVKYQVTYGKITVKKTVKVKK